ncbi:MAG: uracil-DNA glycosylase [Thermoanaerobaculia bacterium]
MRASDGTAPPESEDTALSAITQRVVACRACPRLVAWREQSAADPPKRYRGETYWARPVPGFGDFAARLLIVGLAPAAHGGNRTGRVFTGDSSGDFLFPALHRAGFASQPTSTTADDGLSLNDAYIAAAVRCAPPDNRPTPGEFERCRSYLEEEIAALRELEVIVALGALAWTTTLRSLASLGTTIPRPAPEFKHGALAPLGKFRLIGSYHVSRQNTNTGRLTAPMFDAIFERVRTELSAR